MNAPAGSVDYLKAFLGGVGVSLTPCVYPLIPITAGYIAASAAGSKLKGLFLSLIYVSGLALTYAILGLFASLTGTIFGRVSSHPVTNILVGCIIIVFGLSMLDLFIIPLPKIIKPPAVKKQGYGPAFVLGLGSGLIASPCLTPVLGTILFYLAAKKNLLYGMALLFSFAYGMGVILILVGTFSTALVSLPKSGRWMLYIKRVFAFIMISLGAYFIYSGLRRL